jgi:hypothetical protein
VALKREEQHPRLLADEAPVAAAEVLRRAARPPKPAAKGEEAMPVFWRIFGTTVLSIAALVAVTLYQQLSGSIGELRNQCHALSEMCGDLVKKDEYNGHSIAVANSIKEVQANSAAALDLWRERALSLERQLKADEEEYKALSHDQARELQHLRERLAVLESRQARPGTPTVGAARP